MADSQPVVCTSLHLPPDPQPFSRIHELALQEFLPNFDRLRLALEVTQDSSPSPEAVRIFHEVWMGAIDEFGKLFKVLYTVADLAERYFKILAALSKSESTQEPLNYFNIGAEVGLNASEAAQHAMVQFREQLASVVGRVTTVMSAKYKNDPLFSTANIQLISEILSAIDQCSGILPQCRHDFAELLKRTEDQNSIDSNLPPEEERQVVRAKWQTFLDNVGPLWDGRKEFVSYIETPTIYKPNRADPAGRRKPKQNVPKWRSLFQSQNGQDEVRSESDSGPPSGSITAVVTPPTSPHGLRTNEINQASAVDATEGPEPSSIPEAPEAMPSTGSTSNNSKIPFWRKIFRQRSPSSPSADAPGRPKASNGEPDIPLWRKFFRWAACLSTTPTSS